MKFDNLHSNEEFKSKCEIFLNCIIKNCDQYLTQRNSTYQTKVHWWSNNLRKARNYMKALYRKSKLAYATEEDKTRLKRQRDQYKGLLAEAKRKSSLDFCKNTKTPYGTIKK